MRICFICGSLEPGKDGVGDYTRRLAGELIRLGHQARMVGLNDSSTAERIEEIQSTHGLEVPVLRLPRSQGWAERTAQARAWVEAFGPDWISLQFVPFGFHHRGLVAALTKSLRTILSHRPLHIMFHEMWVGMERGAPLKNRLWGLGQRTLVLRLVRRLEPAVVHTNTPVYRNFLRSHGIDARLLPLFGTIPIAERPDDYWLWPALTAAGCPVRDETRDGLALVVFFGALYPEWQPEPLLTMLQRSAAKQGRRVGLVFLGRLGRTGELRCRELGRHYGDTLSLAVLGEQTPERISRALRNMDLGVTSSPWQLLGKSSAASVMLEHGLPVIVTRDDVSYPGFDRDPPVSDPLLHRLDAMLEAKLAGGLDKRPPASTLPLVAQTMLADLAAKTASRPT